jgi:hypothetical protein
MIINVILLVGIVVVLLLIPWILGVRPNSQGTACADL